MQKRKSEKTNEEAATSRNNHAKKQKTPHKLKRTCKKLDTNCAQIKMDVREEINTRNADFFCDVEKCEKNRPFNSTSFCSDTTHFSTLVCFAQREELKAVLSLRCSYVVAFDLFFWVGAAQWLIPQDPIVGVG